MGGNAIVSGVLVPVGILVLAFGLLFIGGQSGSLGPLDLATAQWVILGFWVGAPVVGGLVSRGLSKSEIVVAAAVLAIILGLLVAAFLVTAAGTAASCGNGYAGSPTAYVIGCVGVGAIVGIGAGASELMTARLAQRGWWLPAIFVGGGLSFVASAGAFFLYYSIVTCMR